LIDFVNYMAGAAQRHDSFGALRQSTG